MSGWEHEGIGEVGDLADVCIETRLQFSAYLDGALDGRSMGELASHLRLCSECESEFAAWRLVQSALGDLGLAQPPQAFQAQLRDVLASEFDRESYLSPMQRFRSFWRETLMPAGLRMSAGLAAALVLVGGAAWFMSGAAPVQANDDQLANLIAPKYLYSQIPPEPITTSGRFVAVLVEADVDATGRVFDYKLIEGPKDPATQRRIESNLLSSVFKPATVFGVPVPGHAMITYTAVSVRG